MKNDKISSKNENINLIIFVLLVIVGLVGVIWLFYTFGWAVLGVFFLIAVVLTFIKENPFWTIFIVIVLLWWFWDDILIYILVGLSESVK